MFKSDYDKIIRENFDLSDRHTRQYIATLEDAGQEQLLNTLSSAMYDNIVAKVDDIDFGTIPMSRGDITKVEGFDKTLECLDIIRRLVSEYKQSTGVVDVVLSAIQNVRDRKGLFMKSYALNVELPMLLYNTVVVAIERSTSLMIATCIEYIKDPTSSSPKMALNKVGYQRTMDDVMFKQLITFNNLCAKGSLDKILDEVMKHPVKEDVEFQFGNSTPTEDDTVENGDDVIEDVVDASPEAPMNTVNPFADPTADEAPMAPADPESVEDEAEANSHDEEVSDNVDPENIPAVVPGDDVTDSTSPINEDEVQEAVDAKTVAKVGAGVAAGLATIIWGKKLLGIAANLVVGALRGLVYGAYYSSFKFSDYLEVQADLIEANANELRYSTSSGLSDDEKGKTIKKQLKWVQKLRKWSNVFALDTKKATNSANKAMADEDKKKKKMSKNQYNDDVILF